MSEKYPGTALIIQIFGNVQEQILMNENYDQKLDLILEKLENIEKHLGIYEKTIYDDMEPSYSIKDTATILGCSPQKVRQYIKYNMLESFRVGYKKMVRSESIKKLIKHHTV